jgi:hypothetical protein
MRLMLVPLLLLLYWWVLVSTTLISLSPWVTILATCYVRLMWRLLLLLRCWGLSLVHLLLMIWLLLLLVLLRLLQQLLLLLLPLLLDALSDSRCLHLQQLQAFSRQAGLQQCVVLPIICHSNLKQASQGGAMAG